MCQLNLYMVSNMVPIDEIINIFEKYNLDIGVENYYKLDELSGRCEFYSTSYHCDCKSIISRLQKENVSSFDAYKIKKKNEDIEKLKRIKTLKGTKDYEARVKEFTNKQDKLLEIINSFSQNIFDYEEKETERIFALNLQDEERNKMFQETLYPKINEMHKELENNEEYQNASKDLQDYLTKNQDLADSTYYNIAEAERKIAEYDFSDFLEEFSNLKNAYREVLNFVDEICIYPFWQDGEALEIKDEKQVIIQNLNIDDLVFLPYRNLLKISSVKE